jgi:dUTP pyrophosphatase
MRIHPRSGTSFRDGLTLTNAEGVIDSDYVGETLISVFNLSAVDVVVDHEDRIAQGEIVQMLIPEFFKSSSVPETMTRSGGFGSTGRGRRAEAT